MSGPCRGHVEAVYWRRRQCDWAGTAGAQSYRRATICQDQGVRNLRMLPKAHLHLHFTGSLRVDTLRDLAEQKNVRLPVTLLDGTALSVPADRRGWFRFQRNYDLARSVV